jgi:hypothetical protein
MPCEAVGNWLYGVAYRTALEAKARNAQRHRRETQVEHMPHPTVQPQQLWHDLARVLDRELSRLPDKYRLPVVLCDLEGRGRQEVAQQLHLAEGTLSSRLARGRKLLAGRLARHGLALSAGTLALALAPATASATPPALVASTIQAATLLAAGEAAAGTVSAPVAALVEGVLEAMFITRLKTWSLSLLCIILCGTGTGLVAYGNLPGPAALDDPVPITVHEPGEREAGRRDDFPRRRPDLMGKIVAVAKDGKSITLETAAAGGRGEPASTVELRIAATARAVFSGVGAGGAKLMEGYTAHVWLAEGSKDTAERLHVMGGATERRGPDIVGRVAAVTARGKTLTLIFKMEPRGRDDSGKMVSVLVKDQSQVLYNNVATGGANLKKQADYYA